MKNKGMVGDDYPSNSILLFRFMKITLFLLLAGVMNIYALQSNAQNARVSMEHVNEPLQLILNDIENQTDYLFIIINKQVDTKKKYSVSAKEQPVSTVLTELFEGENIGYTMRGNHIVLTSNEAVVQQPEKKRVITGTVKDSAGEPLIGASVLVKGTQTGTITGRFYKLTIF